MKNEEKEFDMLKAVKNDITLAASLLRLIIETPEILENIVATIDKMSKDYKKEVQDALKDQINQPKAD